MAKKSLSGRGDDSSQPYGEYDCHEIILNLLRLDSMTKDELAAYYRHSNIVILRDNIYTAREEGRYGR